MNRAYQQPGDEEESCGYADPLTDAVTAIAVLVVLGLIAILFGLRP